MHFRRLKNALGCTRINKSEVSDTITPPKKGEKMEKIMQFKEWCMNLDKKKKIGIAVAIVILIALILS